MWFSLVVLIYQPAFDPSSRNYVVYESTIRHNHSYFNNLSPWWASSYKKQKTSDSDFHQARIVQLYDLLRFLLTCGQTLCRIFHIEYFTFIFIVFLAFVYTLQNMALSGYPGHPQCPIKIILSAVPEIQIGPILCFIGLNPPLVDCVYYPLWHGVLIPLMPFYVPF